MGVSVHEEEEVRDIECISCMECVDTKVCPKESTIICTSEDLLEDSNSSKENRGINLLK